MAFKESCISPPPLFRRGKALLTIRRLPMILSKDHYTRINAIFALIRPLALFVVNFPLTLGVWQACG